MPLNMIIPVGTGAVAGTGITTYSGLVTSAGLWLERSDLGAMIPDFITMVEERLNRILRVPEMEATDTLTIADGSASLPTDLREIRHIYTDLSCENEVVPVPLSTLRRDYPVTAQTGTPMVYSVVGSDVHFRPAPGDGDDDTLVLDYYQEIPALSTDNEVNWLISKHPSIYLRGVLLEAEFYGWNDERLPLIKSAQDEAIDELMAQGVHKHFGGGPLFPRPVPRPGAVS